MASTTRTPDLPHIHLLAAQKGAAAAFARSIEREQLQHAISYDVHEVPLSQLDRYLCFDLVVSPANSYALFDGGFDDAISRAWSPEDDYLALTRAVQAQLYEYSSGYLPPGQCYIANIPASFKGKGRYNGVDWGCKYIALCPTMRTPDNVEWDHEIVYECVWSLLAAIKRHNRNATDGDKIKSILMTPLATGVGQVSLERWAQQTAIALRHAIDAELRPEVWGAVDWPTAQHLTEQVSETHEY